MMVVVAYGCKGKERLGKRNLTCVELVKEDILESGWNKNKRYLGTKVLSSN